MSEVQDSEVMLGTGRLLGLFFGLVVLCAVFFAFGFTLGRNVRTAEASSPPAVAEAASATGLPLSSAPKPAAGIPASSGDCVSGQDCPQASAPEELTFYKAVEQKTPETKLLPQQNTSADIPVLPEKKPVKSAAGRTPAVGYNVQVAAVSRQGDAEALANALRKKQYSVLISTNAPADRLFRVQIGPFASQKEAETTRDRLRKDGYNSILKK